MRRQFIISCIVLWLFAGHAAAADPLADSTPAEIASQISKLRTEIESFSAQEAQHLLLNPDFEIQVDGQIAGWQYEPAPGAVVQTDSVYAHHGTQSMHLESRSHVDWAGPIVSLRSKPFQLPPTRRLAVTAWLRVDPQAPTPSVWLVLEGSYLGQPFAHQLKVGSGQQAVGLPPLSGDWMPVTLQLDELPPEGITDVRVGVDLRGTGDVWVDHMHIDTMWLAEDERQRLISAVASAEVEIKANKLASAQRIVESGIKAELTRLAATDQIAPSLRAVSNALEKAVETQSSDFMAWNSTRPTAQPVPARTVNSRPAESLRNSAADSEPEQDSTLASRTQLSDKSIGNRPSTDSAAKSTAVPTMAAQALTELMTTRQESMDAAISPKQVLPKQAAELSSSWRAPDASPQVIPSELPLEPEAKPRRWWSFAAAPFAKNSQDSDDSEPTVGRKSTRRRPRSAPRASTGENGAPTQHPFSIPRSALARIWKGSSAEEPESFAAGSGDILGQSSPTMAPRLGSPPTMAVNQSSRGELLSSDFVPDENPIEPDGTSQRWFGFWRHGESAENRPTALSAAESPNIPARRWWLPFFSAKEVAEVDPAPAGAITAQARQFSAMPSQQRPNATLDNEQQETKPIWGLIPRWGPRTDEQTPRLAEKPDSSLDDDSFFDFSRLR